MSNSGILAAGVMWDFSCASSAGIINLPTDLGQRSFDTNHFATSLAASSCSSTCLVFGASAGLNFGPPTTARIQPWRVGADPANGVGPGAGPTGGSPDFVIPAFGSLASIANGPGADFAIREASASNETVLVSVSLRVGFFCAAIAYATAIANPHDSSSGYTTDSVHMDLDDFGVAAAALIDQVRIQGSLTGIGGSGPDIVAVAAIDASPPTQVPEPGTLAILRRGLAGLAASRKRNR